MKDAHTGVITPRSFLPAVDICDILFSPHIAISIATPFTQPHVKQHVKYDPPNASHIYLLIPGCTHGQKEKYGSCSIWFSQLRVMKSMKLVIPSRFISRVNSFSDISMKWILHYPTLFI